MKVFMPDMSRPSNIPYDVLTLTASWAEVAMEMAIAARVRAIFLMFV